MTVVTTRPDATAALGGGTITGAATAHAALSDDSNSSYVKITGTATVLGVAEPSIPAGAVTKNMALRLRTNLLSGPNNSAMADLILYSYYSGSSLSAAVSVADGNTTFTAIPAAKPPSSPTNVAVSLKTFFLSPSFYVVEVYVDTTYVAKPTTTVTAPTGSLTTTSLPTVTWSNTLDSDGGAQTSAEVKIFSAAQYGAGGFDPSTSTATDSGTVSGSSTSKATNVALADGSYRAYVRVAQTVNGSSHWSDWDYEAFSVLLDRPGDPTVNVTGETSYGRIKVDMSDTAGTATTDYFEIQKLETDGVTWRQLRTIDGAGMLTPDGSGDAFAYDPEARNGTAETYRVRALHDFGGGSYSASAWVQDTATYTSPYWWVKHPSLPALNLPVIVYSQAGYSREARQGIFQALGSTRAVVVDDEAGPKTGSITFRFDTDAEQDAFDELFTAGVSLLVQAPSGHHWPDRWVRLAGQDRRRIVDKSWGEATLDTYTWTEVGRPTVDVVVWPYDYLLLSDSLLLGDGLTLH